MAKEVVKKEEGVMDLALTDMDFGGVDGFSGVDATTSSVPFIKLMQAISPELNKKKPEYVEGAENGTYLNNITKTLFGDSVRVIPILFERVYIEWMPDRGGFVAQHTVSAAKALTITEEFGKWQTPDGNDLVETYMYYFMLADYLEEGLVAMALSKATIKAGKNLNTAVTRKFFPNTAKLAPSFTQIYTMGVVEASNEKGSWNQPVFRFDGFVKPDIAQMAVEFLKSLQSGEKKADFKTLDKEEVVDREEGSAF